MVHSVAFLIWDGSISARLDLFQFRYGCASRFVLSLGLISHRVFHYFWTNEVRFFESCFDFGLMLHQDLCYCWTNQGRLGESCFDFETDAAPRLVFRSGRMLHRVL